MIGQFKIEWLLSETVVSEHHFITNMCVYAEITGVSTGP